MLFVLSGEVRIGKSRWLEALISQLHRQGIPTYGVLSPGIWIASESEHADANGFEKQGIQSVLLPGGERFRFAVRRDLIEGVDDGAGEEPLSWRGLGWRIDDAALDRVNAHFREWGDRSFSQRHPGLLVVDELGRLELQHEDGLIEALNVLQAGCCPSWPHSLVVVRRSLIDRAIERFGEPWGGAHLLVPDEKSARIVLETLDAQPVPLPEETSGEHPHRV